MSLTEYKRIITSERRVSRSEVIPLNVYRISSYKTTEGNLRSLTGNESSLIIVTGLVPISTNDMKINALKISELHINSFFRWLKTIRKPLNQIDFDNYINLSELLISTDKTGKMLFERHIKPSPIVYRLKESIYRTYKFTGIQYISEVQFDREFVKKELG